jgi:hypothetical protein
VTDRPRFTGSDSTNSATVDYCQLALMLPRRSRRWARSVLTMRKAPPPEPNLPDARIEPRGFEGALAARLRVGALRGHDRRRGRCRARVLGGRGGVQARAARPHRERPLRGAGAGARTRARAVPPAMPRRARDVPPARPGQAAGRSAGRRAGGRPSVRPLAGVPARARLPARRDGQPGAGRRAILCPTRSARSSSASAYCTRSTSGSSTASGSTTERP